MYFSEKSLHLLLKVCFRFGVQQNTWNFKRKHLTKNEKYSKLLPLKSKCEKPLNPCKKMKYQITKSRNVVENIFIVPYNTVKAIYVIYPFIHPHALRKPNPFPQNTHFFSSAARICRLKTVSGNVCIGLQGLRKQGGISRLQSGLSPSRVARAFYRAVANALTGLSASHTFLVHILITGCGIRGWKYFRFCKKKDCEVFQIHTCNKGGGGMSLKYFYIRGELLPAQH